MNIWHMLHQQLKEIGEPAYVSDKIWHMPTVFREGKLVGLVPAALQREARANGLDIVHADAHAARFEVRWHTA